MRFARNCRVLVLAAVVLAVAPALAAEIDRHFHESFPGVPAGTRLHVQHGDGDVIVTAWDRDEVDVDVRYRAHVTRIGLGSRPDFDVEFRRSGDTIHVIGHERGGFTVGFYHSRERDYVYTIHAPAHVSLQLEGDDGDVQLGAWAADVSAELSDGDVEIEGLVGAARLELGDGDLRIRQLRGRLDARLGDGDLSLGAWTSEGSRVRLGDGDAVLEEGEGDLEISAGDGDVRIERYRGGALRVRAGDGDAHIGLAAGRRIELDVDCDEGEVVLVAEPGVSAAFSLESDDGRVVVDLPDAAAVDQERRRASGTLGSGEGRIRVRAGEGDVTLRSR